MEAIWAVNTLASAASSGLGAASVSSSSSSSSSSFTDSWVCRGDSRSDFTWNIGKHVHMIKQLYSPPTFCCLLVVQRPSNMLECLRDRDAQTMYLLPHWDIRCRPNLLSHPIVVYWHQANQPSADPLSPGAGQVSHWITNFQVRGMTWPRKRSMATAGIKPTTWTGQSITALNAWRKEE